jgi:hypothetical protein
VEQRTEKSVFQKRESRLQKKRDVIFVLMDKAGLATYGALNPAIALLTNVRLRSCLYYIPMLIAMVGVFALTRFCMPPTLRLGYE